MPAAPTTPTADAQACWPPPRPATSTRSRLGRAPPRPSFTPTATGCSARSTTPTTPCRTRLLGAWKGLARFEGRTSLRTWLYTIATNASLDGPPPAAPGACRWTTARRRPARPRRPLTEWCGSSPTPTSAWRRRGPPAPRPATTSARVSSWPSSPPCTCAGHQRAVLIMREVLGFPAARGRDGARHAVASVNSALQRARADVDGRLPERTQAATRARSATTGCAAWSTASSGLGAGRRRRHPRPARRGRDLHDAAPPRLVRRTRADREASCWLRSPCQWCWRPFRRGQTDSRRWRSTV